MAYKATADDQDVISRLKRVKDDLIARRTDYMQKLDEADKYYFYDSKQLNITTGADQEYSNSRLNELTENFGAFALHKLAGFLQGMLFNPQTQWGRMVADTDPRVILTTHKDWLETATRTCMRKFGSPDVRFYSAISSAMPEAVLGQGMIFEDRYKKDGKQHLRYSAFPMKSIVHSLDGFGNLHTVCRIIKMTRAEIINRWPPGKPDSPKYDEGFLLASPSNLKKEQTVYHMVMPNDTYNAYITEEERAGMNQKGQYPFTEYYFVDTDLKCLLSERSLKFMPYLPIRWYLRPGADYAEGPGIWAMPDVKELVRTGRDLSIGRQILLLPATKEEAGVFDDDLSYAPLSRNIMMKPGFTNDPISALLRPESINIGPSLDGLERKKEQISRVFYLDRLGTPIKAAEMREVEVLGRQQDNLMELVPLLARIESDVVAPLMRGMIDFLIETGELEPPPEGLKPLIRYQSQLSKAQAQNTNREMFAFLEQVANTIGPIFPEVFNWFDFQKMLQTAANPYVQDTSFVRSNEEAMAVMQERQAQEQQAALAQQSATNLQAQSQAAKNFAQAAEINNQGGLY